MAKLRRGAHLALVRDSDQTDTLPFRGPPAPVDSCEPLLEEMLADVEKLSSMIEMALHMTEYMAPELLESDDFLRVFEPVNATISIVNANLQLIQEKTLSDREEELVKMVQAVVHNLGTLVELN